ncbi:MAG: hypothetical protein JST00_41970 [Deltaproteobacteria bacterium]|nr:hypothetical protein [Deltaproteobacteria bacterium]
MKRDAVVAGLVIALVVAACKKSGPEITCKVNDVCFVCPNEKEKAACFRDPASSRCKWIEPSHCK